MQRTRSAVGTGITRLFLLLAAVVFSSIGTAIASEPSFISVPRLEGWVGSEQERVAGMPHLSGVHLQTSDGQAEVLVSVHALGVGRPGRFRPSGVVMTSDWLPTGKDWRPLGSSTPRCYQQAGLSRNSSSKYTLSGQARCRERNFVLIFNFFAVSDGALSQKRWENDFPKIVSRTETRVPCLTPEEQTFLADREGPPFLVRSTDDGSVRVAARSLCGTGGCICFRYQQKGECFDLILPVEGCYLE
jgi:hypothetical protein